MKYYKITFPEKTYVARGKCISAVAYQLYEEYSFDDADTDLEDYEMFSIEPLKEELTVHGVLAVKALDKGMKEWKETLKNARAELVKEYGLEEGEAMFEEECGDIDETVLILEADSLMGGLL